MLDVLRRWLALYDHMLYHAPNFHSCTERNRFTWFKDTDLDVMTFCKAVKLSQCRSEGTASRMYALRRCRPTTERLTQHNDRRHHISGYRLQQGAAPANVARKIPFVSEG